MLEIIIFTDGSFKRVDMDVTASYAFSYQMRDTAKNVSELLESDKKCKIKAGESYEKCIVKVEMDAVKIALKVLKNQLGEIANRILIHTDSRILIQGRFNDIELLELLDYYNKKNIKVEFFKVKAHKNSRYNELVDSIAKLERIKLEEEKTCSI